MVISSSPRALGRIVAGRGSPRDLGQVRDGLSEARRLHGLLAARRDRPALLEALLPHLTGHGALTDLLDRALVPAPPTERSQGGFIAEGYDAALDELRAAAVGTGSKTPASLLAASSPPQAASNNSNIPSNKNDLFITEPPCAL